jgi:hypothetical protein
MKRFPLLVVAALFGLAVSVPAQMQSHGRSGQKARGAVASSQHSARGQVAPRSNRSVRSGQSVGRAASVRPVTSNRAPVLRNAPRSQVVVVPQARRSVVPAIVRAAFGGIPHHARGRWENRCEQVLVPGYWDVQCHPATFGWVYDACGHRSWGVIEPAHEHRVWVPARYETQTRRVWVRY